MAGPTLDPTFTDLPYRQLGEVALARAREPGATYADLAGTRTTQQRVRLQPGFEAMGAGADTFDSMSSIAPPVGRGYEYLVNGSFDWEREIDEVPELLAEKLKAPSVEAGR